jgi:tetratricopeptide (TPR) repeat protein
MSEMPNPFDKFPQMQPVHNPPRMMRVHGIGTTLIGSRDHDPETDTYVKTLAFTILFLPVLALGAYRVAGSPEGGWYFLGKVPLSGFAKVCNTLLLLVGLGVGGFAGWQSYTNSPEYKASQRLAEADRFLAEGKAHDAALAYRDVLGGATSHAAAAREKLKSLVEAPPASADEAAGIYEVAAELQQQDKPVVDDLYHRGIALAEQYADAAPAGALALLDVVAPVAPKPKEALADRRRLLERLLAANPQDPEAVSRLAVVCEAQGDVARCEALLAPLADKLGERPGAAILGHIYLGKGKYEQALTLLEPYLRVHLPRLRDAEASFADAKRDAMQRAVDLLRNQQAQDFAYDRYRSAGEAEKIAMQHEYLVKAVARDSHVRAVQKAFLTELRAAQAALELGIVQVRRAQALKDQAARKKELEKAEKTFLSVRGMAPNEDLYNLQLARISYWLGKPVEGRKLFEQILEAHNRDGRMVVKVAHVLREVGDVSQARDLLEKAYKDEKDTSQQREIAFSRGVLHRDNQDEIAWLEKGDPASVEIRALLASARAKKSELEGNDAEARSQYAQALKLYSSQPDGIPELNNSSLLNLALFRLSGDPEQLSQAMAKLDRAVANEPDDVIVLRNTAEAHLASAVLELIRSSLDVKILRRHVSLDLLSYLYRDQVQQARVREQVQGHAGFRKAVDFCEKLLILSPRQAMPYVQLSNLYAYTHDTESLGRLRRRLEGVELDLADSEKETKEYWAGKTDAKKQTEAKNSLTRHEAVLAEARKVGGATFAAAACDLIHTQIANDALVPVTDSDVLVRLAEEAHAAAPSLATEETLFSTLVFRAHRNLAKSQPAYKALAEKTQRSLGSSLLTFVLGGKSPLADKALADPDVRRAQALKLEQLRAFPDEQGPATWAFLRGANPQEAAQVAKRTLHDALAESERAIEMVVYPLEANTWLNSYWTLQMAGKESEAAALLKRGAEKGVPLPPADR